MIKFFRRFILLLIVLLPVHLRLAAQNATAEVNGTITDPSGAVVPNATITLTNTDTKISSTRKSSGSGGFIFVNVQPGTYTLTVAAPNFKQTALAPFNLSVNQTFEQNVKLQIGGGSETVEVSATAAELLQRSSSELGTVIEQEVIQDMPLNGRNFTELLTLTPGATPVSTAQGSGVGTQDAGMSGIPGSNLVKPALHGQQNRSTLYYLDGVTNTDLRGPVYGVLPMLDATSQFKLQSHNEKVEFGGVVGGIVNMISRPGTNTIHGSAFFQVRNNNFDARDSFLDIANSGPAPFSQYQFGGTVFFPVFRDRTFLALAYEGWRYSQPTQKFAYVPTAAELSGDFSNDILAYKIYNPYSTTTVGGNTIRAQFMCDASGAPIVPNANGTQTGGTPCLKIPQQLIDPVLSQVDSKFLRAPNFNGAAYGRPNFNYQEDRPRTDNNNEMQVRLDHKISGRDNLWLRFTNMYVLDVNPVVGTIETSPSNYHAYDWGVGFTRLISQHMVFDAQAGILLKPYVFNSATIDNAVSTFQSLGIADAATWGGFYLNALGNQYTNVGVIGSYGDSLRKNPTWSASTDLTFLAGKHNMKIGLQFTNVQRVQVNTQQSFSFSTNATYFPSNSSSVCPTKNCTTTTGNILATQLLGLPSSYAGQLPAYSEDDFSFKFWAGYIQDEWRALPKLTVEFGLRYDNLPVPQNLNGRTTAQLDLYKQTYTIGDSRANIPDCTSVQQNPCIPGGLANVPYNDHILFTGFHKSFLAPKATELEPRVGFAYSLREDLVLRGGYGLFFDALPARSQYAQNQLEAAYWPWATGFSGNANAVGAPLVPFSSLEGHFAQPQTSATPWSNGGYYDEPNYRPAYSNQWNLELQQQIGRYTSLSIAYVGSSNGNNAYTGYGNAAPFALPGLTRAQVDAYRPIPWMVSNLHWETSGGRSNYNALETRIMRQASRDLRMIVSYTWGKSLDDSSGYFGVENGPGGGSAVQNFYDPRSNRSVSSYDIPHFVSFAALYELPAGKGKRFFNHGVASAVLGGWQANNILQFRSGQPFNLVVNGDPANIEGSLNSISGYARPNLNPGYQQRPYVGLAKEWFDPGAFSIPTGSFGNYGRNVMRAPRVWYDDLSMQKRIPIHDRVEAEVRVHAYNVFNIQNIGYPGQNSSSEITIVSNDPTANATAGVGQINNLAYNPRQLSFELRVQF